MKKFFVLFLNFLFVSFVFSQSDVKNVDFYNFTYNAACGSSEPKSFTVTNGLFFEETLLPPAPVVKKKKPAEQTPKYDRRFFKPFQTVFGDLTGDGIDEAVVLTTCSAGGIESFTEGFIFGSANGDTVVLGRIEGGDQTGESLRDVSINDGIITVKKSATAALLDSCCADSIKTADYRFIDGNLVEIGDSRSDEIYPPKRVETANAPSQAAFNLTIPKRARFIRFVVSAEKSKTITVSTTLRDAKIRFFSGPARLVSNPLPIKKGASYSATDSLTVKTRKKGDFVFEVANLAIENIDLNVTVNVEIK